jgi:hypothetical protein
MMDKKMQRALEADGEKLRALTGEDHGPMFMEDDYSEFIDEEQARQRQMMEEFNNIDPCPVCGAVLPENREHCIHKICPLRKGS